MKITKKQLREIIKEELNKLTESSSKKLFSVNPHAIGKAKYSIDIYDGGTHKDGSPFIGIDTAKSKVELASKIKDYKSKGYKEVPNVFNSLHK